MLVVPVESGDIASVKYLAASFQLLAPRFVSESHGASGDLLQE